MSKADVLSIYQVDHVAFELAVSAAAFRRLGKGGTVKIRHAEHWNVELPKEREELLALFDNRAERYSGPLREFGFMSGGNVLSTLDRIGSGQSDVCVTFAAGYNLERRHMGLEWLKDRPELARHDFVPNFIIGPIDLSPLYAKLVLFREQFILATGFEPEEVSAFMTALSRTLLLETEHKPSYLFQLMITGYRIFTQEYRTTLERAYVAVLESVFGRECASSAAELAVGRLLQFFACDGESESKPIAFMPEKGFLVADSMYTAVDLSFIPRTLVRLLYYVEDRGGAVGRARGESSEDELSIELEARVSGGGASLYWPHGKVVKRRDGSVIGEIDGAFRKDDMLIVVEMKAVKADAGFWFGSRKYVEGREGKVRSYLARHERKCQEISEKAELEEGIRCVVPIVCTVFPEYLSARTDVNGRPLFFTRSLPRICAPEELVEFIGTCRSDDLVSRGLAFSVHPV